MALVGADEVVGGFVVVWFCGDGFECEALFGVCGDCLADFGEGDFEGFEFLPLKLGLVLVWFGEGEKEVRD